MTPTILRVVHPLLRTWHTWLGAFAGVALVLWIVSGIAMLVPVAGQVRPDQDFTAPLDVQTVTITPQQALAAAIAAERPDSALTPSRVTLQRWMDSTAYVVHFTKDRAVVVSATSGQVLRMTSEMAVRIAREFVPDGAIAHTERFVKRPSRYFGPVPVWRVTFADGDKSNVFVAEYTGGVFRTTARDRFLMTIAHNVHVFEPLGRLAGGRITRNFGMILAGLASLVVILSGYWLVLSRRRPQESA